MEVIKEGTYTYLLKQIEYRTPVYDESVVHTQNESWDYYLSVEYEILPTTATQSYYQITANSRLIS